MLAFMLALALAASPKAAPKQETQLVIDVKKDSSEDIVTVKSGQKKVWQFDMTDSGDPSQKPKPEESPQPGPVDPTPKPSPAPTDPPADNDPTAR